MISNDWSFLRDYSDKELMWRVEAAGGIVNQPVEEELIRRGLWSPPLPQNNLQFFSVECEPPDPAVFSNVVYRSLDASDLASWCQKEGCK